jgi:ribosomal protein S1
MSDENLHPTPEETEAESADTEKPVEEAPAVAEEPAVAETVAEEPAAAPEETAPVAAEGEAVDEQAASFPRKREPRAKAVEPAPVMAVEEPAPVAEAAPAAAATEEEKAAEPASESEQGIAVQQSNDYADSFPTLSEGDVVKGVVVHIDREGVLVDVGAKSEGLIRRNELSRDTATPAEDIVKVGEQIDVYVMEADSQDGSLILSKKRADFEKAWDRVQEAKEQGKTITAMVTDRVKGGLVVDLGIRGFVPASHVGNGSMKNNLERYVGQSIPLKVIEVDKERRKVVLSNKLAQEEERKSRRQETEHSLQVGQIRRGIVRRLTNYGAFVDLGGIDGLLHISEMSWTRINHPSEVLREGQEIDVLVLKMDLEAGRVSLGLRQILPDPWTGIDEHYHVGDIISGVVSRVVPFGAFVQVEGGIEGIIPNSELSGRKGRGGQTIQQGQTVEVKIIDLRPDERKMTLSLRQARQEEDVRRERREVDDYQARRETREEPRFTIGDALRAKEEAEAAEEQ